DVVDHPNVVLRIVRADENRVWPAAIRAQVIPLRPRLHGFAVGIDDDEAIPELGGGLGGLLTESAPSPGEIPRQLVLRWQLQLAAVGDEDPVWRFCEYTAGRSPDVTGLGECERLRPVRHHVVRPRRIVAALFLEQS